MSHFYAIAGQTAGGITHPMWYTETRKGAIEVAQHFMRPEFVKVEGVRCDGMTLDDFYLNTETMNSGSAHSFAMMLAGTNKPFRIH